MKTWTNPTVEELEVKMTAGGDPWTWWEDGYLPGPFDSSTDTNGNGLPDDGQFDDGRDETTDGQS